MTELCLRSFFPYVLGDTAHERGSVPFRRFEPTLQCPPRKIWRFPTISSGCVYHHRFSAGNPNSERVSIFAAINSPPKISPLLKHDFMLARFEAFTGQRIRRKFPSQKLAKRRSLSSQRQGIRSRRPPWKARSTTLPRRSLYLPQSPAEGLFLIQIHLHLF